uniref:Uncharacterized protein n=1 Tax=Rhipicephalus zambeziensis TaxID=60191 RepID=A0A224YL93_9ACAR
MLGCAVALVEIGSGVVSFCADCIVSLVDVVLPSPLATDGALVETTMRAVFGVVPCFAGTFGSGSPGGAASQRTTAATTTVLSRSSQRRLSNMAAAAAVAGNTSLLWPPRSVARFLVGRSSVYRLLRCSKRANPSRRRGKKRLETCPRLSVLEPPAQMPLAAAGLRMRAPHRKLRTTPSGTGAVTVLRLLLPAPVVQGNKSAHAREHKDPSYHVLERSFLMTQNLRVASTPRQRRANHFFQCLYTFSVTPCKCCPRLSHRVKPKQKAAHYQAKEMN